MSRLKGKTSWHHAGTGNTTMDASRMNRRLGKFIAQCEVERRKVQLHPAWECSGGHMFPPPTPQGGNAAGREHRWEGTPWNPPLGTLAWNAWVHKNDFGKNVERRREHCYFNAITRSLHLRHKYVLEETLDFATLPPTSHHCGALVCAWWPA